MIRNPSMIAESVCESGITKTKRSTRKMFMLAVLAGVYIGFGAHLATTVTMDSAQYLGLGLSKMISGAVFSVGLMLVVIAGAELFTGNSLIFVSLLSKRITVKQLLRNWSVVYFGNVVGSLLLAWIVFNTGLWASGGNMLGLKALAIANSKVNITFSQAFFRGLACNWLVCLAVWMASSAEDTTGKILSCFFPIMAFVASGFEHSIANLYFVPMGLMLKGVEGLTQVSGLNLANLTWGTFIARNLVPVTLGNIVGGSLFVAALYSYIYMKK